MHFTFVLKMRVSEHMLNTSKTHVVHRDLSIVGCNTQFLGRFKNQTSVMK